MYCLEVLSCVCPAGLGSTPQDFCHCLFLMLPKSSWVKCLVLRWKVDLVWNDDGTNVFPLGARVAPLERTWWEILWISCISSTNPVHFKRKTHLSSFSKKLWDYSLVRPPCSLKPVYTLHLSLRKVFFFFPKNLGWGCSSVVEHLVCTGTWVQSWVTHRDRETVS